MFDDINTNIYNEASEKYLPDKIKVLFIAESPPAPYSNGEESYIYFDTAKKEVLLTTITTAIFGDGNGFTKGCNKVYFLKRLKAGGYFLIDAVEYPINKVKAKVRESMIKEGLKNFLKRLNTLKERNKIDSATKLILIKVSVYNTLCSLLKEYGYNILNKDKIDFPKYYNDRNVIGEIRELLNI